MIPTNGESCKFYWGTELKSGVCIKDCGSYVLITGDDGFIYPVENRESFVPIDFVEPVYEDKIGKEIKAFFSNWKAVTCVTGLLLLSFSGLAAPILIGVGCLLAGFFLILAIKEVCYIILCAIFQLPEPYKRDKNGKLMR